MSAIYVFCSNDLSLAHLAIISLKPLCLNWGLEVGSIVTS